ncbi:Ovule protein [Caenorhabditis elegans]|uniref:Ovule protein n=1 Tax=Caenorhabditis elegans TaxID=6239 RepID=Q8MPZ4_CAEEL|nr:Ovule protein [Caenorhabditis elegans]CCD73319.1 Ovule protein [Caenorhabditis elegans]|eukprot:NP_741150.2 Uncharacterized protein CELE_R12B2.7 [Caenorhabditis elegans]
MVFITLFNGLFTFLYHFIFCSLSISDLLMMYFFTSFVIPTLNDKLISLSINAFSFPKLHFYHFQRRKRDGMTIVR